MTSVTPGKDELEEEPMTSSTQQKEEPVTSATPWNHDPEEEQVISATLWKDELEEKPVTSATPQKEEPEEEPVTSATQTCYIPTKDDYVEVTYKKRWLVVKILKVDLAEKFLALLSCMKWSRRKLKWGPRDFMWASLKEVVCQIKPPVKDNTGMYVVGETEQKMVEDLFNLKMSQQ